MDVKLLRQIGQRPVALEGRQGCGVHGFAGLLFLVGKIEQCPNLLDGKTKVAGAPREGKAADMHG
jgi:hypothetical protein